MIVTRHHDFCAAHRLVGHPGKCRFIHGHNYRVHFHCDGEVDHLGMVVDFADIKSTLCKWVDTEWDHKLILWASDPLSSALEPALSKYDTLGNMALVPFNPTAENLAQHLLEVVGPNVLPRGIALIKVVLEETRKCSVEAYQ